jgi:hypothetical protein
LTEEAHQSLEVLSYGCQEELLAHELESSQTQAPQSDLIFQFREQGFHLLSLPLCFGEPAGTAKVQAAFVGIDPTQTLHFGLGVRLRSQNFHHGDFLGRIGVVNRCVDGTIG